MKAVWYERFGAAEEVLQYGEQPIIEPGQGQVLVKLHTSGVNPSDVKKRAGAAPTLLDNGLVIPNSDGAGIIEAVGTGVASSRLGERVWIYNGQYGRRLGTSAEYITVDQQYAVLLPGQASFNVGACIGIPVMTAHRCVTIAGNVANKIVMVTGGSGRVGYYAIQWAKHFGAKVIATAGSERSKKECLSAGADLVVEHPSEFANAAILKFTSGMKVDLVVEGDFGVNLPHVLDILKTSGTIATYSSMTDATPQLPFRKMLYLDINVHIVLVYAMPESAKDQAKSDITRILSEGSFEHRIPVTYPLYESAKAHMEIENADVYGCVILEI